MCNLTDCTKCPHEWCVDGDATFTYAEPLTKPQTVTGPNWKDLLVEVGRGMEETT